MRIKKINIIGLFGMFDHPIELNLEEHITILYGINGIGKTMIFRILDNFFNSKFIQLVEAPFEILKISYENKSSLILKNEKNKFYIEFKEYRKKTIKTFDLSKYKNVSKKIIIKEIERFLPISRIGDDEFVLHDTDEVLSYDQVFDRYNLSSFDNPVTKQLKIENIVDLKKIIHQTKLYFIETQRLIKFSNNYKTNMFTHSKIIRNRKYSSYKVDTVKNYSEELAGIIQEMHSSYSKLSENLELSLGKRLMSKEIETITDINILKAENKILEEKRNELKSVGLFEDTIEDKFIIPDNIDQLTQAVLSVNIQDMKDKLKIFDELYTKLNIFFNILNHKRFSYKTISVHPKKGFVFNNSNGEPLKVTDLSSGEQHEIVMFYELLFKIPKNSVVLVDEPEISLHVAWQKEFLEDMADIIQIRNFDILIATHSPSIINGNWDLTTELLKNNS